MSHIFEPDKLTGRFRQHEVRFCEADPTEGTLPVVLSVQPLIVFVHSYLCCSDWTTMF